MREALRGADASQNIIRPLLLGVSFPELAR
jgi:hypothetical protein